MKAPSLQLCLSNKQVAFLLRLAEECPESKQLQRIAKRIRERQASDEDPVDEAFRSAAAEEYEAEGEIEIEPNAPVSYGEGVGAWIQCWVWMNGSQAGLIRAGKNKWKKAA